MINFDENNSNNNSNTDHWFKTLIMLLIMAALATLFIPDKKIELKKASQQIISHIYIVPPLTMEGGNPYLRALMRTISFSESNYQNPYYVIYGGADMSKI